MLCRIDLR